MALLWSAVGGAAATRDWGILVIFFGSSVIGNLLNGLLFGCLALRPLKRAEIHKAHEA